MIIFRFSKTAAAFGLLLIGASALAQTSSMPKSFETGRILKEDCRALSSDPRYHARLQSCMAYIRGVVDMHEFLWGGEMLERQFCLPQRVKVGEMMDVVVSYLVRHPEDLDIMGSFSVLAALKEGFPCKH